MQLIPKFDWLQVEVTSRCNAICIYCPHTVYSSTWEPRDLPFAIFQKLIPFLSQTRLLYLQGWGEPFLHPDFFAMLTAAKRQGCRVGTTTNGMVLTNEQLEHLVASGLDILAFSLAGIENRNNKYRRGTSYRKVLETIASLNRIKARHHSPTPMIHVAYMLLRSGRQDLSKLPAALRDLGISQIVISTLGFVASAELAQETLTPANIQDFEQLTRQLEELKQAGRQYGMAIHYSLPQPGKRSYFCPENVLRALVVSADGAVSPCVYNNIPAANASFWANGRLRPYRRLVLGNLAAEPLNRIWRNPAYKAFRRSFSSGRLLTPCRYCLKLQ